MVAIRAFIGVIDNVAGVEFIPWMVLGLASFFMFRDAMMRGMGAVGANQALFAYRQVKPVDTVIVRLIVEGFIHFTVMLIFIFGLSIVGFFMVPENALVVFTLWLSLWFFGLGAGMFLSVIAKIVPEVKKIVNIVSLPLMILSGAFVPLQYLPYEFQQYLLLNPIVHVLESIRLYYFQGYWSLNGIGLEYFYVCLMVLLAFGLLFQLNFEARLKAK
jgi:capsular polysaccharide transport system permease protein